MNSIVSHSDQEKNLRNYAQRYADFIDESPSSFHAAHAAANRLSEAGFVRVVEADPWPDGPGSYYLIREGALIAWMVPEKLSDEAGFNIFGCHTDSPTFKLKPTAQSTSPDGWGQLSVEVYGGMLYNSWLDRELELAGVLYDHQGNSHLVRTGPIARIPQLAIHLDREVNKGLKLDPQQHLHPLWTVDDSDAQIMELLANLAGLDGRDQIAAYDIFCATTEGAKFFGDKQQFLAAGRQDNLSSVYAGLEALLDTSAKQYTTHISVLAAFDHEEVGSDSRTGAAGPLLETVLKRTASGLGRSSDDYERMLAASTCISADAGHSVHPNYPQHHDPDTRPVLGRGPMVKINANQRYASNGESIAFWENLCQAANAPHQSFVSNNSISCGSTIGPITSTRLGILTVDVGIGLLSMHSAREMSHIADGYYLNQIARHYFGSN